MNKSFRNLFFSTAVLFCSYAEAAEPYDSVHLLPPTPYYVQDGYTIYSLINTHACAVILDVESTDGGVARYIAQQTNTLPMVTQIFSVNAWRSCDPAVQKYLFQRFLSNVIQENTTQWIVPIRMSSQEGAEGLNITADFIHLVGGNNPQTIYNDILAWYPHLSDTGVMCGNNWYYSSVQTGVAKAASALDLKIQISGNVWYFVKGS